MIGEREAPSISDEEVLVKVKAADVNRADLLQRKGLYPPPPGASDILGLEISGEIVEVGSQVEKWKIGDAVCGLLPGGGYAEYINIDQHLLLPIPSDYSFEEAAAIPEVFLTAYQALFLLAKIEPNDVVLIHAGASGVGTAAIQLVKSINAHPIVTASKPKHEICLSLGAQLAIDYKTEDFSEVIKNDPNFKGVDIIVDFIGAPYFEQNLKTLNPDGRLIILALYGRG